MGSSPDLAVDFWFDPVCPYSWTASRWLHEVADHRPVRLRHHVMSLYLLNESRADVAPQYRRSVEASRGPARVAAGVASEFGGVAVDRFYTAFGRRVFDVWRRPSAEEYHQVVREALAEVGLPGGLEDAMEAGGYDASMRASHDEGVALVGGEAGTPITAIGGRAFFGPVLNAIPRGADAVRVFEGTRLLAAYPEFFELKRTRVRPPVFT